MLKITDRILSIFPTKNRVSYVVLYVFIALLLSSCNDSYTYIISEQDSLHKISHTDSLGVVLMPPKVKYAIYTFVADSSDQIFFYSMPESRKTGGVYDEPEPDSLHLMSNQIFVIPKGTENRFFEENVLKQGSQRPIKNIMFASFKDTITISFLKYLKTISEDEQKKIALNVRLALPEERKAITDKTGGKDNGDTTKTNRN